MKRYFFYTDPTLLDSQLPEQAFGPAGTVGGKDKYRITNLHNAANAPAIAVCDGKICVQEDENGTFSIILKPSYQPPFDFPYIKYFIYKGIDGNSLFSGTALKDQTGESFTIDFIQRNFDDNRNNLPNPIPFSESAQITGKDYDKLFEYPVEGTPTKIFADEQPIDNLFYYPNPDFELPLVRAGEKIGEFASEFGFEIVLERLGYEPKIKLARTFEYYISEDSITDPFDSSNPTSADYFLHWHEKEECLSYIDACAFYGSFCGTKVFYKNTTGNRTKCNTPQEIYNGILNKFQNKNKIYLDIRNDYGYSLNYYKDYGDTILFVKDSNSLPLNTTRSLWPMLSLELPEINTLGEVNRDKFFKTQIRLPHNQKCNVPLVYLSKAYVKNFRRLKRNQRVQFPSKTMSNEFLEEIELSFITIEENSNDVFLTNYYKLNLYDRDRKDNPISNPLAPSKEHYLNGLFKPLDLKQNSIIREDSFRYTIWHEELLVDQTEYGGPQFIAQVGIAEDEHHITLFAFPYYFVHGGFTNVTPDAFTTFAMQSKESNNMFLQEIFDIFKSKELRKQELEVDISGRVEQLDTVVVQRSPFSFLENAFRTNENPEDYVFILFDKVEYKSILTAVANNSDLPQNLAVYLKMDTITNEVDEKNRRYTKKVLDVMRYKKVGAVFQKEIIDFNKNIYEHGHFYLKP